MARSANFSKSAGFDLVSKQLNVFVISGFSEMNQAVCKKKKLKKVSALSSPAEQLSKMDHACLGLPFQEWEGQSQSTSSAISGTSH